MHAKSSVFDILPIFGKREIKLPKHIAITAEGSIIWTKKNNIENIKDTFSKKMGVIVMLMQLQIKKIVPIMTIDVLDDKKHHSEEIETLYKFFKSLQGSNLIHMNQVKISVLGKWYGLPGYLVEEIKHVIDDTKNYDRFFLNFCLNYNGQEEIVDSCRLIARKIKAGKLDIDGINHEMIKDNLYSSYFLPPDLIIKTGTQKCWSSLLLWDSSNAHYYFSGKLFNDFTESDFQKAIDDFNSF